MYASRNSVARALDFQESASAYREIDDALLAASETIHGKLNRFFYPLKTTRTFDWPNRTSGRTWRLWLNQWELQSITSITSGGTAIDLDDVLKYPQPAVAPWNRLEIDRGSVSSFSAADTEQQSISIVGVFGVPGSTISRGVLESAVTTSTATTVDVTDGRIEVGHALLIGSEYMLVTEQDPLDTTQNTGGALADSPGADTVSVADGTAFNRGETILIDSERMRIREVAGNSLVVWRATDGSTLASHLSGADVYSLRRLTVQRGIWGTTAAGHADAAPISVYQAPSLIRALSKAEAENTLLQESAGYSRTVGSGEAEREASGRGLRKLWEDVYTAYARTRSYAV